MNKVLVIGGNGFLGSYICEELLRNNYEVYSTYYSNPQKCTNKEVEYLYCNLLCCENAIDLFRLIKPTYIINCAGFNGGIEFNVKKPYDIFIQNTTIANNVFDAVTQYPPQKIVSLIASCAYNCYRQSLLPHNLMEGVPHESVEGHGYAKRHLQLLTKFIYKQYNINAVTACCTTLYGPRDNCNLNKTKVMMALIKKFVDAQKDGKDVEIFGTGKPRRQFIFAKDAAKCLKIVLDEYNNNSEPCQIAHYEDISIRDLCYKIRDILDFKNNIVFNETYPDGQFKKELVKDDLFNNINFTSLEEGIKETIRWYRA